MTILSMMLEEDKSPKAIIYGLTFFDLCDDKAENALADVQRLSQFLSISRSHIGFNTRWNYHLQIVHKPTRFRFNHKDGSSEVSPWDCSSIQGHLKTSLGLNTLDAQTMGDPKRLCRFPFTRHVNRFGQVSCHCAMPIEVNMLEDVRRPNWEDGFQGQVVLPKNWRRQIDIEGIGW